MRDFFFNLLITPFIGSYAEIHYTLKGLKARYYLNAPEIIFDMPIRCIKKRTNTIPIALIVKDAHVYPTYLNSIFVNIKYQNKHEKHQLTFAQHIKKSFFYHIFHIEIKDEYINQNLKISIEFTYTNKKGKRIKALNDNYKTIKEHLFECFISREDLPFPIDFKKGEPHYHSNYTSDQVEFGAPIEVAQTFAYCMGMDWLFVTDHSYDLDDEQDNYLINNPELPKWHQQAREIQSLDRENMRIIQGEEVSIGNKLKQNVHLLSINRAFIQGKGDSAERWFHNKADHNLSEIEHKTDGLLIAAHPFDQIPFAQKITLNRGNWALDDMLDNKIDLIQAINTNALNDVFAAVNRWKSLLLQGAKLYLLAGNDAHGNFQYMKQIKTPFIKLLLNKKQTFARFFTACKSADNNPIDGINSKYILVSNGPFLDFQLKTTKTYNIGDTISEFSAKLIYQAHSNLEFGEIKIIKLFIGNIDKKQEICLNDAKSDILLELPKRGYIRMECFTSKINIAISNPIWIEQSDY